MPTIYYFWLDLIFSVSWCILTIKDSNRRVVTFIYSYNVYFHLVFTSLVLFRKQIFSLQFCKGHNSVNVTSVILMLWLFLDVVQKAPECCILKFVSCYWKTITNRANLPHLEYPLGHLPWRTWGFRLTWLHQQHKYIFGISLSPRLVSQTILNHYNYYASTLPSNNKKNVFSPCLFVSNQPALHLFHPDFLLKVQAVKTTPISHRTSSLDLDNLLLANLAALLSVRELMCCVGIVQDRLTLPASSGFFSSKSSTWGARNQCAAAATVIFRGVKARRVVRNYGLSTSVSACTLLSWREPKEEQNHITHSMITKSVQLCCRYQQDC